MTPTADIVQGSVIVINALLVAFGGVSFILRAVRGVMAAAS